MPKFTVRYNRSAVVDKESETVEAEYYSRKDDWTTFKDTNNKVLFDVPNHQIQSIRSSTDE